MSDERRHSPAAARNRQPILEVLQEVLPERARVLEVASGSGEHAVHFAGAMPGWTWQPSDPSPQACRSIEAWRAHAGLANLLPPLALDLTEGCPAGPVEVVVAINLLHIAPWTVGEALLEGAERCLPAGGTLFLYGPFIRRGRPTAPSNAAFDAELRQRDPRFGLRELETVVEAAEARGLGLEQLVEMPANNLSLVLRRA
ncbi:hypothetical protein FIU83_09290 [Halomonas sp. THAF5a]|uniref:DUF938 domain-containing protein n=1 Tax=Halomonas sp. THAF5a TaxID=2587844 RepID=UPI001268E540|nr:DUF938 domain-containing protein [Halomonas sp. THAF5a]QFU01833.1 hypothetical protein FIU83_09290 [Halomonas sp. THAF5a]